MFISSSVFSNLEFWSVRHASIYENFELKIFKNIKILVKYLIIDKIIY